MTATTSDATTVAKRLVAFIRDELYPGRDFVALHEPAFTGNERAYVFDAIDSTFVSSSGAYVDRFERMVAAYTGAARAVAVVNGTSALHASLHLVCVKRDDLVITQPLTFVATANAIKYCGADPVFVDVDEDTLGLSPAAVDRFLSEHCRKDSEHGAIHVKTGRLIAACVPMHTFGFPARISEIVNICGRWGIPVVEDAAESLGSVVEAKHTGRFGRLGVFSFNGNKTITTGGGGAIVSDDSDLVQRAKHITTTAKVPHRWDYVHDKLGFNYRLPNLNAALGCAQMEQLDAKIAAKTQIAARYRELIGLISGNDETYRMVEERAGTRANHWLNAIRCPDRAARDTLLEVLNDANIMARPVWRLAYRLPAFSDSIAAPCPHAERLAGRIVNLPSWPTFTTA